MKIIICDHFIPGFIYITFWPVIFAKREPNIRDLRHEVIHGRQQVELLIIPFFVLYGLMWLIELVRCLFDKQRGQKASGTRPLYRRAYRMVPFEREAYGNEHDEEYLNNRAFWAWMKYIK